MARIAAQKKIRTGPLAALDVGTTKVCCLIANGTSGEDLNVVGIGHQASRGIRNGAIVDMEAVEDAIRATVDAAEQMAGLSIRRVVVNLSAGGPESKLAPYEIAIAGHEIGDSDLGQLLAPELLRREIPADHDLVHGIPVGYSIDGNGGVRDPRGMRGDRLGVNVHLISAKAATIRNLKACIAHCDLEVEAVASSPFASALACLVDDARQLGAMVVDMGGGTTSVAVFFHGELVHTDTVPIGGVHVTHDIARILSTPLSHAERMKTLYGNVLPTPSDDREMLRVPVLGEEGKGDINQIQRSTLISVIRPRVEETLEMVRTRLDDAGFKSMAAFGVVLTGGASQLPGVAELAGMILDKKTRVVRPRAVPGLAEAVSGPAFSTCVGLLRYAVDPPEDAAWRAGRHGEAPTGRFGRLGNWLRENF